MFLPICSTDCTIPIGMLNSTCQNRDIRLVSCRWVTFMNTKRTKLHNMNFMTSFKAEI